jgi:hypothetical protein
MLQTPSWEEDFRRAQKVRTVIINSHEYERVRHGQEEECWLYEKGILVTTAESLSGIFIF